MGERRRPNAVGGPAVLADALRTRWRLVLASSLFVVAIAFGHHAVRAPTYSATAEMSVGDGAYAVTAAHVPLGSEFALIDLEDLRDRVADRLSVQRAPRLDEIEPTANGSVRVTVTATSPVLAADAANAYVGEVLDARRKRIIAELERADLALEQPIADLIERIATLDSGDSSSTALDDELAELTDRRADVRVELANQIAGTAFVVPAAPPAGPDQLTGAALILVAAAGGILLGIGGVFVLALVDHRMRRASDVGKAIGPLPVVVVPHRRSPRRGDTAPAGIDALRELRVALHARQVVLFTGAERRSGTTSVVCAFAVLCAATGRRVAVVDAAVAEPRVAQMLGAAPENVCADGEPPVGSVRASSDGPDHQRVGDITVVSVGGGGAGSADVVAGLDLDGLVDSLRARYDIVVIDSTAVTVSTEAQLLAVRSDAVVLVVGCGAEAADVRRADLRLRRSGGDVAVAVLVEGAVPLPSRQHSGRDPRNRPLTPKTLSRT